MNALAERLKEARKQKKLTQRELAAKLSISQSTVALYETGDRNPDPDTLNKLADFFNVSTDWLLGRTNNPSKERTNDKNKPILTRDLLEFLEKSNGLTYGEHPITEKQKRIILDFFKEVVIRNEEKLKE
jgi:HTH-type transcriptional regulator, competence development regulator